MNSILVRFKQGMWVVGLCAAVAMFAACETLPPFEEQAKPLIGLGEKELITCSGLPDASFTTQEGEQVLVYAERRAEIRDHGFGSRWGYWGACNPYYAHLPYHCSPFGFTDDIEIRERKCQVGYWIKNGKVTNIMGENTSRGLGLCARILNRCLTPDAPPSGGETAGKDKAAMPSY